MVYVTRKTLSPQYAGSLKLPGDANLGRLSLAVLVDEPALVQYVNFLTKRTAIDKGLHSLLK